VYLAAGSDAIAVYERDASSGEVTFVEIQDTGVCTEGPVGNACATRDDCGGGECHQGLNGLEAVTVSPDGSCVYTGAHFGSGVMIFDRDPITGALSLVGFRGRGTCVAGKMGMQCNLDTTCDSVLDAGDGLCLRNLTGVADVVVSPDDSHVYVLGSDELIVFSRTPPGCDLGFVQLIPKGTSAVHGAEAVTVAPDGGQVYVAARSENSVVILDRNAVSGEVSEIAVVPAAECTTGPSIGAPCNSNADCGQGGMCTVNIEPLKNARDLAFSADGVHLYVAGGGLPVFSRDAGTGLLTLVDDGDLDVFGLGSGRGVAVSPDGAHVYRVGGQLVLFTRDAGTGEVSPAHTQDGGRAVAVSGDSAFVYTAGGKPALVVYDLLPTVECPSAPAGGCRTTIVAASSTIVLKDSAKDKADRTIWKWRKGAATSVVEFGDLTATDSLAFCVYDESGGGGATELVLQVLVGPGGECLRGGRTQLCWELKGERLKYKSKNRIPNGADSITLKAGDVGKTSIKFKGVREPLEMPALPLSPTVTVQLQSSNGLCWAAEYSTALRNDAAQYKARSD
jgi:6-phosphogluconolactonase (cycloisomerase 2 family)